MKCKRLVLKVLLWSLILLSSGHKQYKNLPEKKENNLKRYYQVCKMA